MNSNGQEKKVTQPPANTPETKETGMFAKNRELSRLELFDRLEYRAVAIYGFTAVNTEILKDFEKDVEMSGAHIPRKNPLVPSRAYVFLTQSAYPLKWL